MVSLSGLVGVAVHLLVGGLIALLLWWLIDFSKVPEPFNRAAKVIVAVFAVLFLIGVLLHLMGVETFRP